MANETLITDLVAQEALDQLEQLDSKIEGTLERFTNCARELARGLKINVEVGGDVDKMNDILATQTQKASQATQQLTQQLQQQQQVIANTTNTISRQLMEQEKLNKVQREAFTQNQSALEIANRILGTNQQNITKMAEYNKQLEQLKQQRKAGNITEAEYLKRQMELKTAKQELQRILANETKMNQSAAGSYQQLSLQLERMKMAQKQLNEEEKNSEGGKKLEEEIQNLDAHLKDLAADMGEFQRNVGNYAVANTSVKTELRSLTQEMAQMLADGVDPTSEEFLRLAERAGTLKDAMADAQATIKDYSNDTKGLTNAISVVETGISAYQVYAGALSTFGMESEEAAKATQKLMGIMSMLNGIQKISTELTTNGTGAYRLYHAVLKILGVEQTTVAAATAATTTAREAEVAVTTEAAVASEAHAVAESEVAVAEEAAAVATATQTAAVEAEAVATQGATTATIGLRAALAALGIGAVIALMVALYEAVKSYNSEAEKELEISKKVNEAYKESKKASASAAAELEYYKDVTSNFNGSTKDEIALVQELNDKYGDTLGRYKSLAEWKSALADIGEYYMDVLEWEARAQAYLNMYTTAFAEGNHEAADRFMENYKFYKKQAAAQASVVRRMVEGHKGNIEDNNKPTGGNRRTPSSSTTKRTTSDDSAREAEELNKQMQSLIDDSTKALNDWQDRAAKTVIDTFSKITSSNKDIYDDYVSSVTSAFNIQEARLHEDEDAAVAAKTKEFEEIIKKAKANNKDTKDLEEAQKEALTAISLDYNEKIVQNDKQRNDTLAKMRKEYITVASNEISEFYANQQLKADVRYRDEMTSQKELYAQKLKEAANNDKELEKVNREYQNNTAKLTEDYAVETTRRQIEALEKQLEVFGLTEEEKVEILDKASKLRAKLADQEAQNEINQTKRIIDADRDAHEKRINTAKDWVQKVSEAISEVGELFSAMYDTQISKVEEQIDAEQQRYDAEVAHIDSLAEHGSITTEEAELRKREAEARTAKAQEMLEKKKASYEYKKAIAQKANQVAQIGISTALGIMQALAMFPPNIPLSVFVGAMGAIQLATALAQPIKAYAEGTKGHPHPGGLAIVGDANRPELIMLNGKGYLTPDSPTLVDLPKGAEVYPDANAMDLRHMGASLVGKYRSKDSNGQPIIINDYTSLENRVANNTKAVVKGLSQVSNDMRQELRRQRFQRYINDRT